MSLAGFTFANALVMVEALAVLLLPAFDVLVLRLYDSSFVSMVGSSRLYN